MSFGQFGIGQDVPDMARVSNLGGRVIAAVAHPERAQTRSVRDDMLTMAAALARLKGDRRRRRSERGIVQFVVDGRPAGQGDRRWGPGPRPNASREGSQRSPQPRLTAAAGIDTRQMRWPHRRCATRISMTYYHDYLLPRAFVCREHGRASAFIEINHARLTEINLAKKTTCLHRKRSA
jgi:hypothetical protein